MSEKFNPEMPLILQVKARTSWFSWGSVGFQAVLALAYWLSTTNYWTQNTWADQVLKLFPSGLGWVFLSISGHLFFKARLDAKLSKEVLTESNLKNFKLDDFIVAMKHLGRHQRTVCHATLALFGIFCAIILAIMAAFTVSGFPRIDWSLTMIIALIFQALVVEVLPEPPPATYKNWVDYCWKHCCEKDYSIATQLLGSGRLGSLSSEIERITRAHISNLKSDDVREEAEKELEKALAKAADTGLTV